MNMKDIMDKFLRKIKSYTDSKFYEYNVNADWSDRSTFAEINNKPVKMKADGGNADTVSSTHLWAGTQAQFEGAVKHDDTVYLIYDPKFASMSNFSVSADKSQLKYSISWTVTNPKNSTLSFKISKNGGTATAITPSVSGSTYTYNGTVTAATNFTAQIVMTSPDGESSSPVLNVEFPNETSFNPSLKNGAWDTSDYGDGSWDSSNEYYVSTENLTANRLFPSGVEYCKIKVVSSETTVPYLIGIAVLDTAYSATCYANIGTVKSGEELILSKKLFENYFLCNETANYFCFEISKITGTSNDRYIDESDFNVTITQCYGTIQNEALAFHEGFVDADGHNTSETTSQTVAYSLDHLFKNCNQIKVIVEQFGISFASTNKFSFFIDIFNALGGYDYTEGSYLDYINAPTLDSYTTVSNGKAVLTLTKSQLTTLISNVGYNSADYQGIAFTINIPTANNNYDSFRRKITLQRIY